MATLKAAWRGDNLQDSCGANVLTPTNGAVIGAGIVGGGNAFRCVAASSQRFHCPDHATIQPGDFDWTLCFWVKLSSNVVCDLVAKWGEAGSQRAFTIIHSSGSFLMYTSADGGNIAPASQPTKSGISVGTWYFVEAYHDSVNNLVGLNVNNGTASTVSHAGGIKASTANFAIGTRDNTAAYYLDGFVDSVLWFNGILSASERAMLYNSGAGWEPAQRRPRIFSGGQLRPHGMLSGGRL